MAGQALEATRIPGQQDRDRAFQGERSFEMTATHSEESVKDRDSNRRPSRRAGKVSGN